MCIVGLKEADNMVLISAFLALDRSRGGGVHACVYVCVCVFKLFMIYRVNSGQPEPLLNTSPCLLVEVEGVGEQDPGLLKCLCYF